LTSHAAPGLTPAAAEYAQAYAGDIADALAIDPAVALDILRETVQWQGSRPAPGRVTGTIRFCEAVRRLALVTPPRGDHELLIGEVLRATGFRNVADDEPGW